MSIVAVLPGPFTWHSLIDLTGSLVVLNLIPVSSRLGLSNACCRTCRVSLKLYVCRDLQNGNINLLVSNWLPPTAFPQGCGPMPECSHLSAPKRLPPPNAPPGNPPHPTQ